MKKRHPSDLTERRIPEPVNGYRTTTGAIHESYEAALKAQAMIDFEEIAGRYLPDDANAVDMIQFFKDHPLAWQLFKDIMDA